MKCECTCSISPGFVDGSDAVGVTVVGSGYEPGGESKFGGIWMRFDLGGGSAILKIAPNNRLDKFERKIDL